MLGKQHIIKGPRRTSAPTRGPTTNCQKKQTKGPTTQTSQPTWKNGHRKNTTSISRQMGPNMGPPRKERDSEDTNQMAYQDHMGTETQNQQGKRTTDKTTRPGLTGKGGRRARQNQRATTAHQRQRGNRSKGNRKPIDPTIKDSSHPTQYPRIQKTGRQKDKTNNGHKDPKRL